jgi:hypothetical protein
VTVSSGAGVGISIADVQIDEGNATSRTMSFKVLLSAASGAAVKYNIATSDGTAVAGTDYTAKALTGQTILAGSLSKNFTVSIKGDTTSEPDETFQVTLSSSPARASPTARPPAPSRTTMAAAVAAVAAARS